MLVHPETVPYLKVYALILVYIKDKFWSCYHYILLWFFFLYYVLQWQWEWLWMSFVFFRFLLLLFNLKLMSCLTFLPNRFGFPLKLHYLSFHFCFCFFPCFFDWFFPRCFYRSKWKTQSFAKNCSLNVPWQKREAMKAFVTSQPGKCLLLWMFCNSSLESLKINSFCDKVLRIV